MSNYILPLIVLLIIIYSVRKCNVYDSFIEGAKEGISIAISIFPSILAIIFSTRIFIASGFFEFLLDLLEPALNLISFPKEVFPLAILRPVSGNAALSIMIENFKKYGVDSFVGSLSSIIQGSTDTTFYVISLYFGVIGIKKIKHTMILALIVDLISIITAVILTNLLPVLG